MIALMGAAGRVGGKVASLLLQRGQKIRVLEHRRRLDELAGQGAHVVSGDAIDVDTLRELFDGADAALVSLPENVADPEFVVNRSRISSAIARALSERRVPHVVALSSLGVDREDIVGPPAGLREFEHALFLLQDANVLALRSAFYMENLLANLPLIEAQKINGSAIKADLAIPMVATRDVAQEAADRLGRVWATRSCLTSSFRRPT
jgi:uncharacterized protein YbjT (DUF2867 family)